MSLKLAHGVGAKAALQHCNAQAPFEGVSEHSESGDALEIARGWSLIDRKICAAAHCGTAPRRGVVARCDSRLVGTRRAMLQLSSAWSASELQVCRRRMVLVVTVCVDDVALARRSVR